MLLAVNYHYIREEYNTPYPAFFGTTPELFRKQLVELSKHGSFVSADDIAAAVKYEKKIPERSIVITFDDGLREQYEYALPVLNELGIPAIFFVNTINLEQKVSEVHKIHLLRSVISPADFLHQITSYLKEHQISISDFSKAGEHGKAHYLYDNEETAELKYILNFLLPQAVLSSVCNSIFNTHFYEAETANNMYFTREQLSDLLHRNFIGSHGHEHLPLGTLSEYHKNEQVSKTQHILAAISGKNIPAFSYPYGSATACADMQHTLQSNLFTFAFTMNRAVNINLETPFYLSRFDNNDVPLGKASKIPVDMNMFDFFSSQNA
jgi:peptidoglycan/xylan/chitin deacetylase (PgdA/CDA1 family)